MSNKKEKTEVKNKKTTKTTKKEVKPQIEIDRDKKYELSEAIDIIKKNAKAKFDETVELHIKLGIDTKKADQQVRSTVVLPNGSGKTKKIAVIAKGEKINEAKSADADLVGQDDIIEDILKGKMDFDILVSTPDMMKDLSKVAKILGPRGMMPNPKSGTVTFEIEKTVKELKAGRIEFKADAYGIVHTIVGKVSFESDKLIENIKLLISAIIKAKPQTSKGTYVQSISISSTMGKGIYLNTSISQ